MTTGRINQVATVGRASGPCVPASPTPISLSLSDSLGPGAEGRAEPLSLGSDPFAFPSPFARGSRGAVPSRGRSRLRARLSGRSPSAERPGVSAPPASSLLSSLRTRRRPFVPTYPLPPSALRATVGPGSGGLRPPALAGSLSAFAVSPLRGPPPSRDWTRSALRSGAPGRRRRSDRPQRPDPRRPPPARPASACSGPAVGQTDRAERPACPGRRPFATLARRACPAFGVPCSPPPAASVLPGNRLSLERERWARAETAVCRRRFDRPKRPNPRGRRPLAHLAVLRAGGRWWRYRPSASTGFLGRRPFATLPRRACNAGTLRPRPPPPSAPGNLRWPAAGSGLSPRARFVEPSPRARPRVRTEGALLLPVGG